MKIDSFYEHGWKNISKKYENNTDKLNYMRYEYEFWASWIHTFYSGEYGIYNTIKGGDAPRYALEYNFQFDFPLFEENYEKNFQKRDHFENHKIRADYIIKTLTKLFNKVENYIFCSDEDGDGENKDFNLDFDEMKKEMLTDNTYKSKWFKAAYVANYYVEYLLKIKNLDTISV